ncbi:MAG: NAD(P)/FAD-dependent oxidoreductase, partial [Candidatus Hodarchaeota archaeon]
EISARVVIGADGSYSIVSRQKKMVSPRKSDRFIGLRVYWDNGFFEPVAHIIYDYLTLPGYIWLFPISKNRANIGMVVSQDSKRQAGRNMVSLFKDFVSRHHIFKELQKNGEIFDRIKASPLNLGSAKGRRVKNGVILVGDAACLINPLTGGGIFNAMLSGKQAALVSASCLRKNDVSQRELKNYEKSLRKTLSASFFYSSFMKRCLQTEKTAYWWLQSCAKNRICANIFLSLFGNPMPPVSLINPLFLFKVLFPK